MSEFLSRYFGVFIGGAGKTVLLSFITVILGSVFGTLVALMKLSRSKVLRGISTGFIEIIRGTPLLVQLYLISFGIPLLVQKYGFNMPQVQAFGIDFTEFFAGILALTINSTAYVAEIIRGGIQSIDKGQMEAARSLGLTHNMAMKSVIIPQAIKNILPALGNEFVTVIKESAIVSILSIHELMFSAQIVSGATFKVFTPYLFAALMYFILTFSISKLLGIAERRMKISD